MLVKQIRPLKEDFETISVRCSELNAFVNPSPFAFTSEESRAETMLIWHSVHHIMQNTMLVWIDSWNTMAMNVRSILVNAQPYKRDKEMAWVCENLYTYAILANEFAERYGKIDAMEVHNEMMLECSWYLVNFSGTMDGVIFQWREWMPVIVDIKTAWAKRKQEKADEERQKYYYAYIYNVCRWTREDIKFVYLVVTKQKKVQQQIFEYTIPYDDAEFFVTRDLKFFLSDKANNKDNVLPTPKDDEEGEIQHEQADTDV